jgi:hypothetical protein
MRKKKRFSVTEGGESVRNSVGQWFKRRIDGITPETDIPETAEYANIDLEMESFGDLRCCWLFVTYSSSVILENLNVFLQILPYDHGNKRTATVVDRRTETNDVFITIFRFE